ncbi:MAG: porin family protein [Bacteroidia bacterium]
MKKIVVFTTLVLLTTGIIAQEKANELRNFRFGLNIAPSVNWLKPEGKVISPDGSNIKFGGGITMEFRLARVASIKTGLQVATSGGQLKYNNGGENTPSSSTVSYYYNTDNDDIVEYKKDHTPSSSETHYQLNERQYKATYLVIPVLLKLKTKEIGMMTYYGEFGLNSSFRWKGKVNDKVAILDAPNYGAIESKKDISYTRDYSIYTAALNFGLGTEVNLSGTTSLTLGVNYNLGFTNAFYQKSRYLEKRTNSVNYNPLDPNTYSIQQLEQKVKQNAVVVTIGVLF